jgi:hypothetical protein
VTPKVTQLVTTLWQDRTAHASTAAGAAAGSADREQEDFWAAMVFVETRVGGALQEGSWQS